ncbi:uncharacterized protein AB675_3953 [Cyphellophora attinorum]|uniref:Uncharacterized protein n=1 Tax=Cyphellophora attinorum TaxID=1664694 RepID=A0A0N1H680_9EURO|nr:uncharacterized protein AB675_3953 [Phialophora attinorum]KPI37563.1 hypothetical protein AB675_3953 [Phialophora attinorum]
MLAWLLLLATQCFVASGWPLSAPRNETKTLFRRECDYKPGSSTDFDCDFTLPTVDQIIAHLRDTAHGGLADDQHSAVFYTNLAYPQGQWNAEQMTWVHTWLKASEMTDKVYWLQGGIDYTWFKKQT